MFVYLFVLKFYPCLWSYICVFGILSLPMEFYLCLWSSIFVYGSVGCKVCGSWVQVYGEFWVHVYAFWVHVCGNGWVQSMRKLGASLWRVLGACLCLLGACLWIGWVHVCGCWVQSIWRRLGAKYMPFGCISDTADSLPDSR